MTLILTFSLRQKELPRQRDVIFRLGSAAWQYLPLPEGEDWGEGLEFRPARAPAPRNHQRFPETSSTFIAALWPGMPLTAPLRWALEPQRKTFSSSVSTPQVPACSFVSAKGNVGASWKMLPRKSPSASSMSTGVLLSMQRSPLRATARQSSRGSASH